MIIRNFSHIFILLLHFIVALLSVCYIYRMIGSCNRIFANYKRKSLLSVNKSLYTELVCKWVFCVFWQSFYGPVFLLHSLCIFSAADTQVILSPQQDLRVNPCLDWTLDHRGTNIICYPLEVLFRPSDKIPVFRIRIRKDPLIFDPPDPGRVRRA